MQHILSLVRRCVDDYHMIEEGEQIAVGVSGGKDSVLTLAALAKLREFHPARFQVTAVTIDSGTPGMDFTPIAQLCQELGVEYHLVPVPIYEIVFEARREKKPCSLCAKMRRGALSTELNRLGLTKIALGHHCDDAVETLPHQLLPARDLSGPHKGHPDPPPAVCTGAGGAPGGAPLQSAGGGKPLPRQRLHREGGHEGSDRAAGKAVSQSQKEAVRGHPALSPVRLEHGGKADLNVMSGGPSCRG